MLTWLVAGGVLAAGSVLAVMLLADNDGETGETDVGVVTRGDSAVTPSSERNTLPRPTDDRSTRDPVGETEPPPVLTGMLTGRFVHADLRAVRGGTVEAFHGTALSVPGVAQLTRLGLRATIGPDGRFVLEQVPPGDGLLLQVDGDDYAFTEVGPFTVQGGAVADLGDIRVMPGMTILGSVSDTGHQPVVGAQVELYASGGIVATAGDPIRLVLTDDQGRFRIPGMRTAAFTVVVTAEGYARARASDAPLPGEQPGEMRVSVQMLPTHPLTGTVSDKHTREPIEGAWIDARALDPGSAGGTAVTDADGRFVVPGVAAGNYDVWASAEGYTRNHDRTFVKRDKTTIEIKLSRQGSLAGTVIDGAGDPVRSFDIQAQYHQRKIDGPSPRGEFRRVTSQDGRFKLENLDAGFWSAEVWAKGFVLTEGPVVRVPQGKDVVGVTITMRKGSALAGTVRDETGQPVAGAAVSLHPNREPEHELLRGMYRPLSLARALTHTDASGRFLIDELKAGTFQVEIDHPGHALLLRNDVVLVPEEQVEGEAFVLERAATLVGTAYESNGLALANVTVHLAEVGAGARQAMTDGKGRFQFERLPPGDYTLSCYGRTPTLASMLAEIEPGNAPEVFTLHGGETLSRNVTSR